ncbi:glycosyltransferase family 2 protein [Lasiosphaeris hirsuta]|uniref:Glycosyltransferase family 2 protein n=1 Tax=Lasiosphaeris hirsuta TaxID=260670 RepID=A0AA40ANQ8_9PEZI|nr:glycosyltransferase family 2 protein [Lasiosphaeris hirsuta]
MSSPKGTVAPITRSWVGDVVPGVFTYLSVIWLINTALKSYAEDDWYLYCFLAVFVWRYLRYVVHFIAFWLYKPFPLPSNEAAIYTPSRDVTVILPTVEPEGEYFQECLFTCAQNSPAKIIVVTAGDELYEQTLDPVSRVKARFPGVEFVVGRTQVASKREQVSLAIPMVTTAITVMLDDHVNWGPRFLQTILAPFEDLKVGMVGTNKRGKRIEGLDVWKRFWNMLGALYLMRHNYEIRATNTIDGGVFVVSARTCAMRTEILQHPEFLEGYTNDKFFFGLLGPLNADDDNYNTRFVVRQNWKIKIQYSEDAEIMTDVGAKAPVATKFLAQCRRWARTTWRSNARSLIRDGTVWRSQQWCVYAVFLTSFTNFALFTDPALVFLFCKSSLFLKSAHPIIALARLVAWILLTKITKVFPYYWKYPQDIYLFPAYLAFGYAHSLIKFWAMLTFWDAAWSGRNLSAIVVDDTEKPQPPPRFPRPAPFTNQIPDKEQLAAAREIMADIDGLRMSQVRMINGHQTPMLETLLMIRNKLKNVRKTQDEIIRTDNSIDAELRQLETQVNDMITGLPFQEQQGRDLEAEVSALGDRVEGLQWQSAQWKGVSKSKGRPLQC